MPTRSSPFDRLSSTIVSATAGRGLRIEESVIKRGLATRQPREIEFLVMRGNGEALFMVECCAYKRAQSSLWIEQLDYKRVSLGFECVLAVSRSGFTRAAQVEARDRGIATARLSEAEAADWSNWMFDIPPVLVGVGRGMLQPALLALRNPAAAAMQPAAAS